MSEWIAQLMSMMTLVFAIASIIAGIFTAYFGSGKSRAVGAILILIGLVVFVLFMWGAGWLESMLGAPVEGSILYFRNTILQGIIAIVGALIGALVALGIFLLAIMKA
jgi:hypothetical protein